MTSVVDKAMHLVKVLEGPAGVAFWEIMSKEGENCLKIFFIYFYFLLYFELSLRSA